MPSSSIRNGYSFVPCVVPRYFTIRSRRVEICSVTRWSRKITQSETYSSRPWRVSVPSPRSPVMTAVTPSVLEPAEQPPQLGAQDGRVGEPAEQRLDACRARRAWRRRCRWRAGGGRTAPRGRTRRSPRSRCARRARSRWRASSAPSSRFRSKPSDATFAASSSAVSSNAMKTPGSPNSVAPRTRNSIANSVLPQPAPPQTSVGRPRGSPPPVISSRPWIPDGAFGSGCRVNRAPVGPGASPSSCALPAGLRTPRAPSVRAWTPSGPDFSTMTAPSATPSGGRGRGGGPAETQSSPA